MVDKIESQLDSVEEKIGDKLHFLDKDGDGILDLEEMADALQRVLKRTLSKDEAMAIAALMVRKTPLLNCSYPLCWHCFSLRRSFRIRMKTRTESSRSMNSRGGLRLAKCKSPFLSFV
jgi:hypothetical protein